MKKIIFTLGSLLAVLSMYGCNPTTTIKLDSTAINIAIGDSKTIKATVTGNTSSVKWSSKNENIVKVDSNTGLITSVAGGKTQIVASANGVEAICDVTVRTKVIILGVDGAGDWFNNNHSPNVYNIFENDPNQNSVVTKLKGCLTSDPTISAQCWGSMLTGVSPEIHGFTNDIIESTPNTEHPSVFLEAKRQIPDVKLASIVNWSPINVGIVENGIGIDKRTRPDDKDVKDVVCNYIKQYEPDLLYVQFDSVDHAGHTYDYQTEKYFEQYKIVDGYIGEIYETLKDNNLLRKYDFIVTADHGGKDKDHGKLSDEEKYIFFGITGDNIKKHEGNKRLIENMNVIDIAAITAHALGISNNYDWGKGIEGGIKVPEPIFAY